MKRRNSVVILLILLVLVAIVALFYEFNNATGNNSLSKGLVCDFPCWQEITPQETNFAEALLKMQEKYLVTFAEKEKK